MKVVIIGSGNVATVLGRKILLGGHEIVQVVSRSMDHAKSLASLLKSNASNNFELINTTADIYMLCIADNAISKVAAELPFNDKLVVHTAGAVSSSLLNQHKYYGTLYPLQSLRKEVKEIPEVPILVDGNLPEVSQQLYEFASGWASTVSFAKDDERLKLHLAAVFVSNFTNHLYTLAEDFCKNENVDFSHLLPLITETALRLKHSSPSTLQTGPAVRNDTLTMNKHLEILNSYIDLKELYTIMSKSISKHQIGS